MGAKGAQKSIRCILPKSYIMALHFGPQFLPTLGTADMAEGMYPCQRQQGDIAFFLFTDSRSSKSTQDCAWESG